MRSVSMRPPGAIRLVPTLITRRTVKSLAIYQPIGGLLGDVILRGAAAKNPAGRTYALRDGGLGAARGILRSAQDDVFISRTMDSDHELCSHNMCKRFP